MPTVLVEFSVRLGYAIFTVATLAFLGFGTDIRRRAGDRTSTLTTAWSGPGYWWETLFPALAIASLIVGINLVTDSVERVLAG